MLLLGAGLAFLLGNLGLIPKMALRIAHLRGAEAGLPAAGRLVPAKGATPLPELPDLYILARSMDEALCGRTIGGLAVNQPKCLNLAPEEMERALCGCAIEGGRQRGKWALLDLSSGDALALNLGMGGEVCLHGPEEVPDPKRERVTFCLDDGRQLWAHFWWFGMVHLVPGGDLAGHQQLARLGPEPLAEGFTVERLAGLLRGRRGALKKYLLDQAVIAGIGNVYVQDTLWRARLHPLRPAHTLGPEEVARLHGAIQETLWEGIRWGGGPGEKDVWGNEGQYPAHFQVGYRTGRPCPACGTAVEELRVGQQGAISAPSASQRPSKLHARTAHPTGWRGTGMAVVGWASGAPAEGGGRTA